MAKPKNVAVWRERLKRWRESGAAVTAFCQAEGISTQAFYTWRRKLNKESPSIDSVDFVQVAGHEPIELDAGGVVVRVRAGFDEDALIALLDVLTSRQ